MHPRRSPSLSAILADEGVLQLKFDHAISDGVRFDVILGDETLNASGSDLVSLTYRSTPPTSCCP
ncbi:MAG: hypothetical protein CM15mP78_03970 [Candidatus Poseidoniales archaeon]|nr:MAG: hypothetical protein CM15mP78_03970 [Candidatus Poseidoniales archaeon]